MRTYAPSPSVLAPEVPLYQMGTLSGRPKLRRRHHPTVFAPKTPLYQLGLEGLGDAAQIVKASTPIDATLATSAAAAAGAGSWAGPIGIAAGAVIGIIAGLMAAHELRKKQAQDENSAVDVGVSGFDSDLATINQAFNSGQLDANGAMQAVQVALQNYWALVTPHIQPGRDGCSNGANCGSVDQYCKSHANGAACCVGCTSLVPSISGPHGILAAISGQSASTSGPNVANIQKVFPSSYGTRSRSAYTLSFKQSASSSSISSLFSPGSGGSILPWLLAAGAAFLLWEG